MSDECPQMRLSLVLGLCLFLLAPALISTHTILTGPDYTALVEWTKYWTIAALAGVLEIAVLKKVRERLYLFPFQFISISVQWTCKHCSKGPLPGLAASPHSPGWLECYV